MREFNNISASEMEALKKQKITEKDFINSIPFFSPEKSKATFGKINLMFYIDRFGNFTSGKTKTAIIARALYNSLDSEDKKSVMSYLMEMGE